MPASIMVKVAMRVTRIVRRTNLIIASLLFLFVVLIQSWNTLNAAVRAPAVLSTLSVPPATFTATSTANTSSPSYQPEQPCSYSDRVDLRVIILTYNRPVSLIKLLESLDALETDGATAALEIWIDRSRKTDEVNSDSVKVASAFQWIRGPTRVHVHSAHVGIYGQWINTWRPPNDSDQELALILEDDLSVSKYAYRWVLAVFRAYSYRTDFVGASLTSHQMVILSPKPRGRLAGPKNHTVMMYKCFGTWGFTPKPSHWRKFQDWYHTHKPSVMQSFRPTVPGSLPSIWYMIFASSGRAENMWSIWFIYYMHVNHLYSVYSNLVVYTGSTQASLVINRMEAGLHYRKRHVDVNRLLTEWKHEYVKFPTETVRLHWDGSYIPSDRPY